MLGTLHTKIVCNLKICKLTFSLVVHVYIFSIIKHFFTNIEKFTVTIIVHVTNYYTWENYTVIESNISGIFIEHMLLKNAGVNVEFSLASCSSVI